ncbi:hypothetical protein AAFF_G00189150 [Aldrovandia affinis]|uniref:Reverse transcriptase zinc-binding domain-containing protein n=1 Tax=Aldrovandia affinis TaxID=143900 RepID=A0AAD7VWN2_9TELE|nr:hypothetical protein AAFF_G00189150 [Aldrovandia affinis]
MHRHGCAASPLCPRGCGAPETVSHVFWDCPFAGEFWTLVLGLLRRVGPGHVLSRDGVVYRRGLGLLPSVTSGVLWDVLGYAKWALWEDRVAVVGKRLLFGRGRARGPPPVLAANHPLVGVPPVTVPDPETPKDWGDTEDPGDGAEGWNKKPVRKRPLSGEHQEGRGRKEAPAIPLDNRFGVLAGSEEGAEFCTDMDLSLESPLPFQDGWVAENILGVVDMDQTPHGVGDVGGAGAP